MYPFPRTIYLLLAALLCSSAADLRLKEQKEKEGVNLVHYQVMQGGADDIPGMPENLQVRPQGPSAMLLTWSEPSSGDVDHYFVYVEGKDLEDNTPIPFKIWEDLEPCTTYTFGVKSVSSKGDLSDPALQDGLTDADTPPEPRNLQVKNYTDTSMTLAWEKPDTECDIVQYRVSYIDDDSQTNETQGNETTVKVSDLFPETNYTFNIYASTSTGEGPAASVKQATAPDPGGPPQDLVAEGISSSAINVSWSEPYAPPSYYLLTAANCNYNEELVYDINFIIENLEPCQRCYITVTSYYEDTDSRFPATTVAEASGGAPPAPNECSVEVKQNFITVTWEKPITPCGLGPYNVSWTLKKLWGNGEEESDSTNTPGKSYTIYNPPPYHKYTFEIAASINEVFGSPTSCNATSLESASGPPVLVSVESEEQGEVRVIWERPAEENGKIIHYGIFVNDEANYTKQVSGDVFNTTVSLTPCFNVDISVAARNGAVNDGGWGERSEVMNVTDIGDVSNLTCEATEPGVIALNWKVEDSQCPVTLYNVTWTFDSLWSEDTGSGWKSVDGNGLSAVLELLPPFSSISVEVSVNNSSEKTTCTATTLEEVSSAPTQLHQIASHVHSLTVEWSLPEFLRGRLVGWYLYWTSAIGHFVGEHVTGDPEERVLEIRNLEPSEVYYVYVMAVNGAGRGDVALLEVATEYVPERDGDLTEPRLHTPAGDGGP